MIQTTNNHKTIKNTEKHDGNIIIDGVLFKMIGHGRPIAEDYIAIDYESADWSTAKICYPITDQTAFRDGDLDCCDWDNFDDAIITVEWDD